MHEWESEPPFPLFPNQFLAILFEKLNSFVGLVGFNGVHNVVMFQSGFVLYDHGAIIGFEVIEETGVQERPQREQAGHIELFHIRK